MRTAVTILATAGLALLAAACGRSPASQVAQLGSTTTRSSFSTGRGGASNAGASQTSQLARLVAFGACMRSNGVPKFPDPNSFAKFPGAQQLGVSSPQFQAAMKACKHLLPNGGNAPTHAVFQQEMTPLRPFSQCMRSHGITDWPDPSVYTNTNGETAVVFNFIGTSLDGNAFDAPQVQTKIKTCRHLLPSSHGGPPFRIVRN